MDSGDKLLQQARTFDEQILSSIFDEHYGPIYRYIYHYVHHVETAEDLTAETFMRMLEQLNAGRGPDRHLKAWLFRVAHNLIVDEFRYLKHRPQNILDTQFPSSEMSVEDIAQKTLMASHAYDMLTCLTQKQRAILHLKYVEGMKNAQIADVLGLSVGAVKSLQHRGLSTLRRYLGFGKTIQAKGEVL